MNRPIRTTLYCYLPTPIYYSGERTTLGNSTDKIINQSLLSTSILQISNWYFGRTIDPNLFKSLLLILPLFVL